MSPGDSFHGSPRFFPPVTSTGAYSSLALSTRSPGPQPHGLHHGGSVHPASSSGPASIRTSDLILLLNGPGWGSAPLGTRVPSQTLSGALSVWCELRGLALPPKAPPSCRVRPLSPGGLGTEQAGRGEAVPQPRPVTRGPAPRTRQSLRPNTSYPSVSSHIHEPPLCKAKQELEKSPPWASISERGSRQAFPRVPPGVTPFSGTALSSEGPILRLAGW